MDQWILSELHRLIGQVDEAYNDYEPTKATRLIADFVQRDFKQLVCETIREEDFGKETMKKDKIAAYQTLFDCLLSVSKLMAPVAPFYAGKLYRDLCETTQLSQYACAFSTLPCGKTLPCRNPALEDRMGKARTISSLALSFTKR